MAQGVFAVIRNPATQSTDELPQQEALEQLATLSILTRWNDCCELVAAGRAWWRPHLDIRQTVSRALSPERACFMREPELDKFLRGPRNGAA